MTEDMGLRMYYQVALDGDGNQISTSKISIPASANARGDSWTWTHGTVTDRHAFWGASFVSADHALKLAAEERQKWLREQAQ